MIMKSERFDFKHFSLMHGQSSMKVGVDSILLGCWTDLNSSRKILDVGTGCGLLALMCAQRVADAEIDAIEIDSPSFMEADNNFKTSPWKDRLSAILVDFSNFNGKSYDLIISNPPYFNSGVNKIVKSRERARHQDSLSPKILIERGRCMLTPNGKISMIIPFQQIEDLSQFVLKQEMAVNRLTIIKGREELPPKRAMIELVNRAAFNINNVERSTLVIEKFPGQPTEEFKTLCKDFYLEF